MDAKVISSIALAKIVSFIGMTRAADGNTPTTYNRKRDFDICENEDQS